MGWFSPDTCPSACQMNHVCAFCVFHTLQCVSVCTLRPVHLLPVWSACFQYGDTSVALGPADVCANAARMFTLNHGGLTSDALLLPQLWISLFLLLTAGGAEGWGAADKRHPSVCGRPRIWLLFY